MSRERQVSDDKQHVSYSRSFILIIHVGLLCRYQHTGVSCASLSKHSFDRLWVTKGQPFQQVDARQNPVISQINDQFVVLLSYTLQGYENANC